MIVPFSLDLILLMKLLAHYDCEVKMRNLDLEQELDRIEKFIQSYCQQAGLDRLVIGLSGGIDSSVSAVIAARALGADKVTGLYLPYKNSNPSSLADAQLLAQSFDLCAHVVDISPMVDSYFAGTEIYASPLRKGNFMARMRMSVLYDYSSRERALVLGTSNRTELLVGYFTQHGDGACAFEPIGHLYKTEVRGLARILGVPQVIINKAPTADLWEGQTDEQELGITYPILDEILYQLTEMNLNPRNSEMLDFPLETYLHVEKLIAGSAFKRALPAVLE